MTNNFCRRVQAVLFDCDSTLAAVEGIDELAARKGCRARIAALTNNAMDGLCTLEEVYGKRLDIIQPTRQDIAAIAQIYCQNITVGAAQIVRSLRAHDIKIAIVSGGLRQAILPMAAKLNIAADDVYAVDIKFNAAGDYHSLLPSPLITTAGKSEVIEKYKIKHGISRACMIGDGISDVAALGAAQFVIGYGGVIVRPRVVELANHYSYVRDLSALLPIILNYNN